ncbi:MAG TPA: primase-helicase family protein, partial [Bacteroidota bacterium]|nr:primase-helicase family protein [Bacteroidota bacterium]
FCLIGAHEKDERQQAFEWLMQNHHFKNLTRVEQIGDMDAKETYFEVRADEAMVRVHHAPIKVQVEDNVFIEDYLEKNFGKHKDFIKQYLAVFCYTNYKKLPFLILTGKRGAGKNSFAEWVGEIFQPLSMGWGAKEGQFTPEYEKKLLYADETVTEDHKQYLNLKRQSGSKYLPVNKKFQHPYQVRNNVNIIITSNAQYPIQVERDEIPSDEKDNQFFVYKMERQYNEIDATYADKLRARLGHYIRTELKTVFEKLDLTKYRYSIPVPITDYEKELFASSITPEEDVMDKFLLTMKDAYDGHPAGYAAFLKKGFVPSDLFDDSINVMKHDKHKIVKLLRTNGYLTKDKVSRPMNGERKYCYTASALLMTYLSN